MIHAVDKLPCRRAAVSRNAVLGAVAVLLLVAAALIYLRGGGAEDEAPADEFFTLYCPKCNHTFQISYQELDRRQARREYRVDQGRGVTFRCEKCGEFTASPPDGPTAVPGGPPVATPPAPGG